MSRFTDSDRAALAQSLDITSVVCISGGRHTDPVVFALAERDGNLTPSGFGLSVTEFHRERADRGIRDGRWAGLVDLSIDVTAAAEIPGAGPVFDLLHTWALRTARNVTWDFMPGSMDDWTVAWSTADPEHWTLRRRGLLASERLWPTAGRAVDLLIGRPGDLDDEMLLATVPFRRRLRSMLDQSIGRFELEALLEELGGAVRHLAGPVGAQR